MTESLFNFDLPLPVPPGWDDVCVVDLESRSTADLTKTGTYKYAKHPTTEITMVAWQIASWGDRERTELWTLPQGKDAAEEFFDILHNPRILLLAYNAPFERTMFAEVWGIRTPLERWQDIMVMAYAHAFSGRLKDVCAQMEMPEALAKDAHGNALVLKFCKSRGRNRTTGELVWWDWISAPKDWTEFGAYCRRDVTSEARIAAALSPWPLPDWLWDQWRLDQRINERGAPIDMDLVLSAIEIAETEIKVREESTRRITGIQNPNSVVQLRAWLKEQGCDFANLQKATVAEALARAEQFPDDVVQVLKNRREASKTNWKKFLAMDEAQVDGRLYGMFQFCGAGRTGREAGRIVQLQNLARGGLKDPDAAAELVKHGNWDLVSSCYDESVMEVLTGIVRSAITAPEGKVFTIADLKSIESCVIAWEAQCKTITDLFYQGRDTYKYFATQYYNISYDQVTKEQRTFCKPPVLGAGYQLGWLGLIEYAKGLGVKLKPREAQRSIRVFRDTFWEIPEWWYALRDATFAALANPHTVYAAGPYIRYMYDGTFLLCVLPSGRAIYYYRPEVQQRDLRVAKLYELDDGRDHVEHEHVTLDTLTYMGINQKATSQKWQRISVSPGSLAENNTQAIARDLFYHGLERMDGMRLPSVWQTHDDAGNEVPTRAAQEALQAQVQCMTTHPPWAGQDLFLGAEGAICKRNRKT